MAPVAIKILGFLTLILLGYYVCHVLKEKWSLPEGRHERPPTLAEELPPEDRRGRPSFENMTLAQRNTRDKREAAKAVARWKKKGLL